jgi:hypothetical protein
MITPRIKNETFLVSPESSSPSIFDEHPGLEERGLKTSALSADSPAPFQAQATIPHRCVSVCCRLLNGIMVGPSLCPNLQVSSCS